MTLRLRTVDDADLDALFAWESHPGAVRMAAFTRPEPTDRRQFDAHYARVRADRRNTLLAIEDDGVLVGTVSSFTMFGEREVSYWIDPTRWGAGLASQALHALLEVEQVRPLYGRVAQDNAASARVLLRNGFVRIGEERSFAPGRGAEITEHIYRLDRPESVGPRGS